MKMIVRASVLSLALAGLVAGLAPNHSAAAQAKALSHQAVSSALPAPTSCPWTGCGVGQ